jgi:hypothetical protein
MCRDSEVKDPATIVRQHQKHMKDLKPDGRHREEVYRTQALDVVLKECPPGLGGWLPTAQQVFAHASFADIDAEVENSP